MVEEKHDSSDVNEDRFAINWCLPIGKVHFNRRLSTMDIGQPDADDSMSCLWPTGSLLREIRRSNERQSGSGIITYFFLIIRQHVN